MTDINLISAARLQTRKQRAQVKRWVVACSIYSAVLLVGCGVYRTAWGLNAPGVDTSLEDVQAQSRSIQEKIDRLQARLVALELSLQANRDLKEHPDWSLLLRFLATMLGDDLFLHECDVQAITPGIAQAAKATANGRSNQQAESAVDPPAVRLTVAGMGRSLEAVSQFALRIEQTQLFTEVKLADTRAQPYHQGKAIAFRVVCTFATTTETDE